MAGIAQNGQRRFIFVVFPLLRIDILTEATTRGVL